MRTWRSFGSFPTSVRLLIVNQFGVNVGFYMLIPYIAIYLTNDLGVSAAITGLVLGVRTMAQQGLMLLGGSLADRVGFRPVIIAGLAFRSVAFGSLAAFNSVGGVFSAVILTGLAGALFAPAVRAYISAEAEDRRAEAFALFNVFHNAGMFVGPLLGAVFIALDFRLLAIGGAITFAILAIAQLFRLPHRPVIPTEQSMWQDWMRVLRDRGFLIFTLCASPIFAMHNQFYLTLPLKATEVTGIPSSNALIFAVAATVTIFLQVPVVTWCRRHWAPGTALSVGLLTTGLAFTPLAIFDFVRPGGTEQTMALIMLGLVPVVLTTALLGLGETMNQPFASDRTGAMAPLDLSGTYFGMFTMTSGLAATVANFGVGHIYDVGAEWDQPALPWLVLCLLGLAGAAGMFALQRRGILNDRHPAAHLP